ncbi:uncharacterized protein N0V89_001251 [Didymosphaeria variabile]|uniref:Phospholipase A2 n=1 Tax=Didymosphaeria variabile TaxID=1932322 RepID=A0A9W8XVW8_9PLEO|nr:uncharacterized protein N0V89_001251 [Didymosphaeria variabile]KAJ4360684.1 hypothetical protein N0V89_001251 [Didymosphaeria variabile]
MRFPILIAALVSCVAAAPTQSLEVRETAVEATDRLVFKTTLAAFITARNAQNPSTLDWSSDGCSSSPDNPFGFDFLNSCYRHDFGYRNFKAQSRFTDANKLRIDDNFHNDLYNQCDTETFTSICKDLADVYYAAVRAFGKKAAAEVLAASVPAANEQIAKEIARRAVEKA